MNKKASIILAIIVLLQLAGYFFKGTNAGIVLFISKLIVGTFFIAELLRKNKTDGKIYEAKKRAIWILVGAFIIAMIILLVAAVIAATRNN